MTIKTLTFNTLTALDPYVLGGPPDNLVGYTQVAGSATPFISGSLKEFTTNSSTTQAIWYDNTNLTGTWISSEITLGSTNSASIGTGLCDSNGHGWEAITNESLNTIRIFLMISGQLSGSALFTVAQPFVTGNRVKLRRNKLTGEMQIWVNDAQVGTSYTSNTYNPNFACAISRGGRVRTLTSEYSPAFDITALTSPLVCGGAFSGTSFGFSNGAATLSFGGVSVGVTIASNAFSGTLPMIADNVSWPRLPSLSTVITLTQGANTATISRDISLPVGYNTTRDASNVVANFAGIVADNSTYLGYWFNAASNPLTTSDSVVFPTSSNYTVYQDSGVGADTASLPRTDTIYVYRNSSGKYFEHIVNLSSDTMLVVINLTGWTEQATSPKWDGAFHHSVRP